MNTSEPSVVPFAATTADPNHVFPPLTAAQIGRIAPQGRRRAMVAREVLVEVGQQPVPFFVVLSGQVQVLRPSAGAEVLIVSQG
jgi:thioredoxin reductase (NADPH)